MRSLLLILSVTALLHGSVAGLAGGERALRYGAAGSGVMPEQDGKRSSAPKKPKKQSADTKPKNSAAGRVAPLRFIWPTAGKKIVEGYGEWTNPSTGIVTMNPGINIAARKGAAVMASESGRVSLVSWLPGYGTIIIVQHREGYRTVYGNLASAAVKQGSAVRSGEKLGTVGAALGKAFLHFEVWRDQTRLDPTALLR